jgi:predicted HicB family RNase H-like nuclease
MAPPLTRKSKSTAQQQEHLEVPDMTDETTDKPKKTRKPPRRKTTYQSVLLRMSVEEKAALIIKAAEAEKSLNQFILDSIESAKVQPKQTKNLELREQNIWLNRINSNLNMIAKHANIFQNNADGVLMMVRLMQIRKDMQEHFGAKP